MSPVTARGHGLLAQTAFRVPPRDCSREPVRLKLGASIVRIEENTFLVRAHGSPKTANFQVGSIFAAFAP